MPVRLPWRDEELRLVVVKGFGRKPMMLLTNLAVNEKAQAEGKDGTDYSYKSLWQVVEGYLTRWRIEETIRFVKQCYGFEHIRVMSYASWRNMSAIVLARTTDSRRCRDGTSCRTLASDSQRPSEEAGSPASEEARGCKRRRDLRTQPAVLPRQGRLNEVCCLR